MQSEEALNSRDVTTPDTLMDLIRQLCPPNLIQATMQQYRTALIRPECRDDNCTGYVDSGQWRDPNDSLTWKFKGEWTGGSNILGLVFFAIILGISLATIGEKGKPLLAFFSSLADAMMTITTWVIRLAPVGVFFLIGGQVLATDDFGTVLNQLGWYFSTVLLGSSNLLKSKNFAVILQFLQLKISLQDYLFTDLWSYQQSIRSLRRRFP